MKAAVLAVAGLVAAGALAAVAVPPLVRAVWWCAEATPPRRGSSLARELGCFACHGPEGMGGVANPGHPAEAVPGWDPETAAEVLHGRDEIREWIVEGFPARLAAKAELRDEYEAGTLRMPAYGNRLSAGEVDALVAYVATLADLEPLPADAARGRAIARQRGCFGCHGAGAIGDRANAGSLKGYVPGWRGDDFAELVRDERELRDWILSGTTDRFEARRVARWFARRQALRMPAYSGTLAAEEVDDLVAYVRHLRGGQLP